MATARTWTSDFDLNDPATFHKCCDRASSIICFLETYPGEAGYVFCPNTCPDHTAEYIPHDWQALGHPAFITTHYGYGRPH